MPSRLPHLFDHGKPHVIGTFSPSTGFDRMHKVTLLK